MKKTKVSVNLVPATKKHRKMRFTIWRSGNAEWYWHLKSPNGKIVCQSEGYKTKAAAHKGVNAVMTGAWDADVLCLEDVLVGK